MSGGTVRSCTTCGAARHCMICGDPDNPTRLYCPAWRPIPASQEKKPVAGCEYCRLPVAAYHEDAITGVSVVMFSATRTMIVMDRHRIEAARFSINCCPNCGRDLRGD